MLSLHNHSHLRHLNTVPLPPAALNRWIQKILSLPPTVAHETLNSFRARQLQRTLPTRVDTPLVADEGNELPRGHHFVYFQSETPFAELGRDGSSTVRLPNPFPRYRRVLMLKQEYNAPSPFLRRMWAGGSMIWNDKVPSLKIGETVTQAVRIADVEYKKGMVFVHQQRDIHTTEVEEGRWAVRETRTHVFRPDERSGQARTTEGESLVLTSS